MTLAATRTAASVSDDGMALATSLGDLPTTVWVTNSREWTGPALASGLVSVYVTDANGSARTYSTGLTVQDRQWSWSSQWTWMRGDTAHPVVPTVPDHEPFASGPNNKDIVGLNCPVQSCQLKRRVQPDPVDSLDVAITIRRATNGVNMPKWYIANMRWNMRRVANLNPSITQISTRTHPTPLQTAPKKCKQGLGAGPKATSINANWWAFNNYCGGDIATNAGRDMTAFVNAIWAHEGFGSSTGTGHESLAQAEAGKPDRDPYKAVERWKDDDSASLANRVRIAVLDISTAIDTMASDSTSHGPHGNMNPSGYLWYWDALGPSGNLVWDAHPWLSGGF